MGKLYSLAEEKTGPPSRDSFDASETPKIIAAFAEAEAVEADAAARAAAHESADRSIAAALAAWDSKIESPPPSLHPDSGGSGTKTPTSTTADSSGLQENRAAASADAETADQIRAALEAEARQAEARAEEAREHEIRAFASAVVARTAEAEREWLSKATGTDKLHIWDHSHKVGRSESKWMLACSVHQ